MTSCPICGTEVPRDSGAWSRCPSCRVMVFAGASGPEVIIGHESERVAAQVGDVLMSAGMSPVHVKDPEQIVDVLVRRKSSAVVLDVALEGARAFQIIEKVRGSGERGGAKIILIASVFNRTAYKRRPSSLYGADGYVEQHHIPDHLPERLCSLLGLPPPKVGQDDTSAIASAAERHDLRGEARLAALAHSIVADIALYHQAEIALAARGEPAAGLSAALNEGRRLLADMIDPRSYAGRDPILDAFRNLITKLGEVVS